MPLTEAVWLLFTIEVFGGAVSTPTVQNAGYRRSELVPQGSGLAILFASSQRFRVRCTI